MFTRKTIQSIKKQAKYLKKHSSGLRHHECLDLASQEVGFNSYKHALGLLASDDSVFTGPQVKGDRQ